MIQYLNHSAINRQKWDDLIAAQGLIYAHSWYLDIVHPDWEALVLEDYAAVMPLTGGKKFSVSYLFQPFFAQQLGIISRQLLSPEQQTEFLLSIPQKYRFAEIRLNESNAFDNRIQGIEYHRNVVLEMNRDYDTIRANYHTNTKRNLAKAEGNGLKLVYETELSEIIDLFRANRGSTVKVWGDAEYTSLMRLNEAAMYGQHSFIVGVKHQETNELLCGGLFMMNSYRVIFLFSGCSERGKQLHAMTLMMDDVIKDFAGHSITFDFEGSDDDNLARFYLGFGGEERPYPAYSFNHLSAVEKGILRLWKRLK
jgi:hypothetical protein